jgi:probable rRNA maturation factor
MNYQIDIEINSQHPLIPSQEKCEVWITAVLQHQKLNNAEVSIYVVDEAEGRQINRDYRNKDYATNVLSFPADIPEEVGVPLLGDLVICAPVIEREAKEQHKDINALWAHMLVHGSLHLLGYDHMEETEADLMEELETRLLQQLGFPPPYAVSETEE